MVNTYKSVDDVFGMLQNEERNSVSIKAMDQAVTTKIKHKYDRGVGSNIKVKFETLKEQGI